MPSRALPLAVLLLSALPARAAEWEEINFEDGIRVWQKDVEGSSLVAFRGQGVIESNIRHVLAVLYDQDRKTEWLARCRENRLVRAKKLGHAILYNRIRSDFPLVSDRDTVVETGIEIWPEKGTLRINVKEATDPLAPVVDGVVRMPSLRLSWTLTVEDRERTLATYEVHADPGGMLPAWLVNYLSKEIPFKTISNLRKQVKKDGYEKERLIVESAFDWEAAEKAFLAARSKAQGGEAGVKAAAAN